MTCHIPDKEKVFCPQCGKEAYCYDFNDKFGVVFFCENCKIIFEKKGELRIRIKEKKGG
jgi:hypothetical protein